MYLVNTEVINHIAQGGNTFYCRDVVFNRIHPYQHTFFITDGGIRTVPPPPSLVIDDSPWRYQDWYQYASSTVVMVKCRGKEGNEGEGMTGNKVRAFFFYLQKYRPDNMFFLSLVVVETWNKHWTVGSKKKKKAEEEKKQKKKRGRPRFWFSDLIQL